MSLQNPRGASDLLFGEAYTLDRLVRTAAEVFERYAYKLIETPCFENIEVFARGIGQATDVVGKEMYNVFSADATLRLAESRPLKPEQRLALRPEGTAGVARAVVQHNLVPPGSPAAKLWYFGPMFRHERPQKGRFRQFHQIGVECLGAVEPTVDAEVVIMLMDYFDALGIPHAALTLKLNSMGDDACRPAYREQVREFILAHSDALCPECLRRADSNPLRAFDCKSPECQQVMSQAPLITNVLCGPCREHYETVKLLLKLANIDFVEDPRLVRGLDYYTRTVFEVQVDAGLGAQNAIGGGGRYDKLLEEFGGKPTPGLGFAVGLERVKLVQEALGIVEEDPRGPDVFVVTVSAECQHSAFTIVARLRQAGISADMDHQGRSLKSQLKVADKAAARYALIIGPDELAQGHFKLRSMTAHSEELLTFDALVTRLLSPTSPLSSVSHEHSKDTSQ
ncbi:MAG: histidine--tRNA ligase [Coriobacteriales bacterium]|jgi:histidyl-tRNA synthetase|nr:histidine--tRNA ligase [Coriobacteriales bacterium]